MKYYRVRMRFLLGSLLVILLGLYSAGVQAAEPQLEKPGQPQAEEEAVTEKKPPEKPLEVLPKYVPGVTPFAPYSPDTLTLGTGPSTGILAPYGYGLAEDTLIRGWQSHNLGPVKVSPYLEYDALYRTNVFQSYSNKKADFVNTVIPGIRFELPVAGTHRLSLGYLGNYFGYCRFGENSHYDQNVNADAALNFSKLSLKVGTTYRNATEEASLIQVTPTTFTSQQRVYNRVSSYFQAAYKMADRWRIETNYLFDSLSFAKSIDQFSNVQTNTFGGTIFYKFWPKTSALVQFITAIRTHPFDSTRNNVVYTPMAGLTWDPTAKLSGTIKVGYTKAVYTDNNNSQTSGFNPNGLALSIQTLYKLSRYTQMSLIAQRSLQEDVDRGNASYFNTGLLFTLTHFWHYYNVTSYASFSYYNNNYTVNQFDPGTGQLKKRDDNIVYAGAGLSRPITRWLRLRFDYLYYNKGSTISNVPTNEHKVLLGAQTSF